MDELVSLVGELHDGSKKAALSEKRKIVGQE
jgi:hypothetical protein